MNVARKLSGILLTISVNGFASNSNFLAQTLKCKAFIEKLKAKNTCTIKKNIGKIIGARKVGLEM